MADEKIIDWPTLTDSEADDNTRPIATGRASDGKLYRLTIAQGKLVFGTRKEKYTASGSEGTTITIADLAGRYILAIFREGSCLYEVASAPDTAEFTFDSTNITLGLAANAGERFLVLYKNI